MAANVLNAGGVVVNATNQANSTTFNYYMKLGEDLFDSSAHGASLHIDTITGGTATIQFSNDGPGDSDSTLIGTIPDNATAAQLNALSWEDETTRYAPAGAATISAPIVIKFDTNVSERLLRVVYTTNNAANSLKILFRRK